MKKLLCICLCLSLMAIALVSCTDPKKPETETKVQVVTNEVGETVTNASGEPVTEIVTVGGTETTTQPSGNNNGLQVEGSGEGITIYFDDLFN